MKKNQIVIKFFVVVVVEMCDNSTKIDLNKTKILFAKSQKSQIARIITIIIIIFQKQTR